MRNVSFTTRLYDSPVQMMPPGDQTGVPLHLFNSSLDGNARRAIDIHEGEEVDESAFKALSREAVALNSSAKPKASKKGKS